MKISELANKVKIFLNTEDFAKNHNCVRFGMTDDNLIELKTVCDQLWKEVGKDNKNFNELVGRNYQCLNYEIENYKNFPRNKPDQKEIKELEEKAKNKQSIKNLGG